MLKLLMKNGLEMTMLPPDPIYIFKGEMQSVSCIEFQVTPLIQRIYAGTHSGNVHVWNLKSKREIGSFSTGNEVCLSICIPPEGDTIITQTKSGTIAFWSEAHAKWQLNAHITLDFFGFCRCQLLDGILYTPIKDSKFQLISTKSQQTQRTIALASHTPSQVMAFKLCPLKSATLMLIAYEGHGLALWDLADLSCKSSLSLKDCPMAIDYHVGTNRGLCGDPTDKVLVFSLDEGLQLKAEREITLVNAGVAAVGVRPDGKLAAVGCWDGKLRLYSWKRLVLLAVLEVHSGTIEDVAFCRSGEEGSRGRYLLAAGSKDSRISLWDLYN